jgi:AraC-like DNA-binding protein
MPFNPHSKARPQVAIVETRQSSAPLHSASRKEPASFPERVGLPRGVLKSRVLKSGELAGGLFSHSRLAPPASLASWIQHFWMVEWDLRDASPRLQETLPHPNVYLVFEQNLEDHPTEMKAEISGVTTGKFSKRLEGHSRVFGVKFKPGGFRAFLSDSTSSITDRIIPAQQIFGSSVLELAVHLSRCPAAENMLDAIGEFLGLLNPAEDASAHLSAQLVEMIFEDQAILTVDQLAEKAFMSVRSMQRLFKEYVGVPPKWVIRRYRLHELVERLNSGQAFDGAQLALDLGYADQAHLIHDFRNLVGYTPTAYRKLGTMPSQQSPKKPRPPSVS